MSSPTTAYEKSQSFNPLMKWVHSHRFKEVAQIIGTFNRPLTIYDIGCGYAHLYDVLKDFKANYIGIDNHPDFVAGARARHRALNFKVFHASSANFLPDEPINVVTALETLEHMTERDAAKTLDNILKISPDMLICSVPVETGCPLLLKNVASFLMRYTRHTEYTWKETFYAALSRLDKLPIHTVSHKGFDWRRLLKQIEERFHIEKVKGLPLPFLAPPLNNTAFIVAVPRLEPPPYRDLNELVRNVRLA